MGTDKRVLVVTTDNEIQRLKEPSGLTTPVLSDNGTKPVWIEAPTGGSFSGDAVDVTYDPTTSGLTATDVQAAIDEVVAAGGGSGAPDDATYLTTTANAGLSNEVVVGATPGGELGGTWASPAVDATHSGSTHAATQAAAEATAAAALSGHTGDTTDAHDASAISIVDSGGYFTGTDVEAALQELGAAGGGSGDVATDAIWDARGDLAVGTGANTAAKLTAGTDGDILTLDSGEATGVKWAAPAAGGGGSAAGWVGDGSDGNMVLDGTNTFTGLNKSGNVYTMTRDFFADDLTIDSGVTLQTAQYRLYVLGTLTVNGTLSAAGRDASVATGGSGPVLSGSGTLGGSQDGANGRTNSSGAGNSTATLATRAAGGRGGAGGSATSAGGTAGTVGPTSGGGNWRSLPWAVMGNLSGTSAGAGLTLFSGGTGGGSGGSNSSTTTSSGAGGGGGGVMVVCATTIVVGATGTITAAGGNGSNATGTGAAGGGGGGGGGVIVLLYESYTNSGTVTVAGGTHGNGVNGGNNGSDGSAGSLLLIAM